MAARRFRFRGWPGLRRLGRQLTLRGPIGTSSPAPTNGSHVTSTSSLHARGVTMELGVYSNCRGTARRRSATANGSEA